YSYVYLTVDGYFKGKPLLVKEKAADMLQINVPIRAPYNFTPYEGKKVRIYLRKWSEGDIRIFCGHYGIEEILEHTKEVPTMMDIPHFNLTPQPGEYFTYHGNKSKILLNDSRLKYCFLYNFSYRTRIWSTMVEMDLYGSISNMLVWVAKRDIQKEVKIWT
ncbi:hypothetical protein CW714_01685, partial [Methanophagales archaeon]